MGFEDEAEQSSLIGRLRSSTFRLSTTSLIGRLRSSTFRLSTTTVSMSLTGSRFSSESALGPFHYGIRGRGGTILSNTPFEVKHLQTIRSEEHTSELQSPCNLV